MFKSKFFRLSAFLALVAVGVWAMAAGVRPSAETMDRHQAQMSFAMFRPGAEAEDSKPTLDGSFIQGAPVTPAEVADITALPTVYELNLTDELKEMYEKGLIDLNELDGPVSDSVIQSLIAESEKQGVDPNVQNYNELLAPQGTLNLNKSFKTIDYTQSQQGVPPDPDIAVGLNHVVVGVNTSFQIFDKNGTSVAGPTLFKTFWGSNCGGSSSMSFFDPFLDYDEKAGRYILGITAYNPNVNGGDNGYACIAVSKTNSATGGWWLYSFDGNPGAGTDYFFDYPHLGVGEKALYLSANMFGASFVRNHVMAFNKTQMYAGASANSVKYNVSSTYFTLQPAKMHGYGNGGWPSDVNQPHFFMSASYGNSQNKLHLWKFNDPFGTPSFTYWGSVTVNTYSMPVNQKQSGGSDLQGNDNRMLDVKYWGGFLWGTHTVGCNPGTGTVNCIRWYKIGVTGATPTVSQQGTFSANGIGRSFPAIAPDKCGNMLVGYTRSSTSTFPSVYVAGRESADAAGTLKSETLVKSGEAVYTSYDAAPYRWGDYTGLAIDPDGKTFWYLGEYSRSQATARWSTWVGSYRWSSCP